MILQWKSQWPYLADCVQGGIWVMIIHTPSKLPHSTCLISVSPSESVTFQLVCWADSVVNMTSYKTKDAFSKLNTIIHDLVDHCAFCVYWLILAFQVARVPQLLRLTWCTKKEVWFNLYVESILFQSKYNTDFMWNVCGKRVVLLKRTGDMRHLICLSNKTMASTFGLIYRWWSPRL